MFLEAGQVSEAFIPHLARVRPIPSMNLHVSCKRSWIKETFSTHFTLVWFITRMTAHVYSKTAWLRETFVTSFTLVRFIASMNAHMSIKWTWVTETIVTNFTLVRSITSMNAHVYSEVTWQREIIVTNFTLVRFITSMHECACVKPISLTHRNTCGKLCIRKVYHQYEHVYSQVTWPRETLVTNLALIRFVTSVKGHVCSKNARLSEALVTNFTLVRLVASVSAHVYSQILWTREALVTNFTLVRFVTSVNGHVYSQIPWTRETFVTNFALVRFISSMDAQVLSKWDFWEKSLLQILHMYGLSPEWMRMWILSALGVLHTLSHTLHICLVLLSFSSPCFVWVHDALDFLFVDTTASVLDISPFVFKATLEDGTVGVAVRMVLSVISALTAGTISASDNTQEHQQLCTKGP